jgi:lipid-A-disaccharide synthase
VHLPVRAGLLARHGVAATYVGHPLANVIPLEPDQAAARRRWACRRGEVIAILPGSRKSEIQYLARAFSRLRR